MTPPYGTVASVAASTHVAPLSWLTSRTPPSQFLPCDDSNTKRWRNVIAIAPAPTTSDGDISCVSETPPIALPRYACWPAATVTRDQIFDAFVPVGVHASVVASTVSVALLFAVSSRLASTVTVFIVVFTHADALVTVIASDTVPCCGNVVASSIGTSTVTRPIGAIAG